MAKYKINRERFIRYLTRNYLGSVLQQNDMIAHLLKDGEYTITAKELLKSQTEWPGYLVDGEAPISVKTEDCELIYKQP